MAGDWKYWAFLSYSHQNTKWGNWLHKAIEAYRVPGQLVGRASRNGNVPKRLFPVFRDREELPTSSDLGSNINEALKASRYLIVICSPQSAVSHWVNEEIKAFKAMGREDRILCLIVDGEPNASDKPDSGAMFECFPPAVRFRADAAGSLTADRTEPLAADVRKGKDSIDDAKLKIIAGLIGVGFDELKLRDAQRTRRGRLLGMFIATVFAGALLRPDPGPLPQMRFAAFDFYQTYYPRVRQSAPVVIIEIDEPSLARVGQWPWSRDTMAQLMMRIAARKPAAIGVGIVFAEPDRLSPERLAQVFRARDPIVADRLAKMRPNDSLFAESIKNAPVVLGVAGDDQLAIGDAPYTPSSQTGPTAPLRRYQGELRSLPELDRAAAGHGLLNVDLDRGVVRRILLGAQIGENRILSLSMECLRVAAGEALFRLDSDARGLRQIVIGDLPVSTQADGSFWIHYSPHDPNRYVSAVDVLEGRDDPSLVERKIVLLGVTALGLVDQHITARGESMPGIEIHAQVIENLFENSLLRRPAWARLAEALAFALAAAAVIFGVPRVRSWRSVGIPVVCWALVAAGGFGAYLWARVLLDPLTLIFGINVLYGIMVFYVAAVNFVSPMRVV